MRVVHEKRRDHKCPHCNSRFGTAGNMRTHCSNVHEKVRAHKCPHCNNLMKHTDTVHLKLREHACPNCPGVAFGDKRGTSTNRT